MYRSLTFCQISTFWRSPPSEQATLVYTVVALYICQTARPSDGCSRRQSEGQDCERLCC
ncbi:MAG: hypothetical protein O2890_08650 [Cyanobacteria bacterium]|nr:hypothetical protein [Cyanobacteriota bacterium]MDA0866476.1 hypothetical protein [Cyanobacteriota bacterium]